jgi:Protein of unknown function (DUF4239)
MNSENSGMHVLLHLPTALSFLIVALSAVSLALLGLFLVRRQYPAESLKANHEVAAIIFNAFGWLYAVMVAFAVFVTWTGYTDASRNLQLEASCALDVFYSSNAFPPSAGNMIRQGMIDYLRAVEEDELTKMSSGDMVFRSRGTLRNLVKLFENMDEASVRNRELYAEALHRLDSLAEYRRLRIFSGSNTVPPVIWLVLLSGGIITIGSTYFFGMPRSSVQYIMTAMLAFTLSLILFLIFVLDHPFIGANRVSDVPLRQSLTIMRELTGQPAKSR